MPAFYNGNYMNPYQTVGMSGYQTSYGMNHQMPMSSNVIPVDGEVGAKAYMVPNGSTGPIALWDTNDNVIYMRTFNAAGMPNPLKKLRYTEEEPTPILPPGQSGAAPQVDMSNFVTKEDFEQLRNEIRAMQKPNQAMSGAMNSNQNGSNPVGRGRS